MENSPNIAKNNHVSPGKGKEDKVLILTYLNSPMAEAFSHYSLSFSILAIFRGKRVINVGPKAKTSSLSLFHENSHPSIFFFQTMLLFARVLPLVRILAILHHIWGRKCPKTSQKGPWYAKL